MATNGRAMVYHRCLPDSVRTHLQHKQIWQMKLAKLRQLTMTESDTFTHRAMVAMHAKN